MQQDTPKKQAKSDTRAKKSLKVAEKLAKSLKNVVESKEIAPSDVKSIQERIEILPLSEIMTQKLYEAGLTPEQVAKWLFELCNWKNIKVDKNGEVHEFLDGKLRLEAIKTWDAITGISRKQSGDEVHQHLHLEKMPDDKLDALIRKTNKG